VDGAADALAAIASQCARDDVVAQAMLEVSRPIAAEMGQALYERVRRVTGETGASIAAERITDETTQEGVVVVEIGPRTRGSRGSLSAAGFKVKFWERGTSKLPARPFMRPVWDQHERTFSTAVTAGLRKAYATVAARFARRETGG
jgi:HK97 gp10 family phage protein